MRNAVVIAAFAASALAAPHNHKHKRDEVIVTDVEYVTAIDIVTVTADAPPPAYTTAAAPSSSSSKKHHWHWSKWTTSTEAAPAPTSTEAAPVPTSTSTYIAPAPSSYEESSSSWSSSWSSAWTSSWTSSWTSVAAPTTTQAPVTTAKPTSTAAAAGSYSAVAVDHHNLHRANHSAPDIEWDDALAATAQKIADSCVYAHNVDEDNGGYGQNIAAGVKPENISAVITDLFYNGEVNWYDGLYGEENPDMTNFEHWGHFSQIVWKSTTHVGCATTDCSAQGLGNVGGDVAPYFTVCNYKSPGNFGGEYGDNIKAPAGHPTADWDTGSWVE